MEKAKDEIAKHFSSQSKKTVDAIVKVLSNDPAKTSSGVKKGVNLVKLTDELAKQKLEKIRQEKDESNDE